MRSRMARSTAWSASVTGVRSGLVSIDEVGGTEAVERDGVGGIGDLEGERQVGGVVEGRMQRIRRSRHPA